MAKLSGLQKSVLALYRRCLKQTRFKPADSRDNWAGYVRDEFRRNTTIDKKDFATIEFLMRQGERKLTTYSDPGIKNISR